MAHQEVSKMNDSSHKIFENIILLSTHFFCFFRRWTVPKVVVISKPYFAEQSGKVGVKRACQFETDPWWVRCWFFFSRFTIFFTNCSHNFLQNFQKTSSNIGEVAGCAKCVWPQPTFSRFLFFSIFANFSSNDKS